MNQDWWLMGYAIGKPDLPEQPPSVRHHCRWWPHPRHTAWALCPNHVACCQQPLSVHTAWLASYLLRCLPCRLAVVQPLRRACRPFWFCLVRLAQLLLFFSQKIGKNPIWDPIEHIGPWETHGFRKRRKRRELEEKSQIGFSRKHWMLPKANQRIVFAFFSVAYFPSWTFARICSESCRSTSAQVHWDPAPCS